MGGWQGAKGSAHSLGSEIAFLKLPQRGPNYVQGYHDWLRLTRPFHIAALCRRDRSASATDLSQRCRWAAANDRSTQEPRPNKNHAERIVFAYEASGLGYGLSDELNDTGIECHVLSPTHLPKTPKSAKAKTDAKDAQMILEQVRGFVLAGNKLPVVWTPPQRLRDDRELVRARIDVGEELTRVKVKITSMFKRYPIGIASPTRSRWTKKFIAYVRDEVLPTIDLAVGAKLECLMDRYEMFQAEQAKLDKAIDQLARTNRYKRAYGELRKLAGVGRLVAMTFLTEMGDLTRFPQSTGSRRVPGVVSQQSRNRQSRQPKRSDHASGTGAASQSSLPGGMGIDQSL